MDVVKPLPVFSPAGVAAGTLLSPPKTRVVLIHGLRGPPQHGIPLWAEHWLPPDSSANDFIFYSSSKPSDLVGRDSAEAALETAARGLLEQLRLEMSEITAASYVLWAEDLGGTVVKLALVIAAAEAGYRPVLEMIQAIVFFGTPHRASSTHSLGSTILTLIEACYKGLLGDWIPELVNRLSRQLEDVHERFGLISHQFSIISHYQRPSSSESYRVLVKDCATLGLSNEISIGCDRPHKDMPRLMGRQQQSVLQVHLINAKIAHWGIFQNFSCALEPAYSNHILDKLPMWTLSPYAGVIARCSSDVKLADWVSAKMGPGCLHVQIGSSVDVTKLLHSIASALWRNPRAQWASCPSADLADAGLKPEEPVGIYVDILKQVLAQQPRAFLHMQHLVHLATDAISSRFTRWAERILWMCLEALIHAPLGIPVYAFLHIKTTASIEILQKIKSAIKGTDSMFRLVLVSTANIPVDASGLGCVDFKFQPQDLEDCRLLDTTKLPDTPIHHSSGVDSSLMDTKRDSSAQRLSSAAAADESEQLLALRIQMMGRSVLIVLTWIAFATRPLFRDELEMFLAFDRSSCAEDQSNPACFRSGLAPRLPKLLKRLPDIVFVNSGRMYLHVPYDKIRRVLLELWQTHAGPPSSPHLYVAHSCLTLMIKHTLNAIENENPMDVPEDANPQDSNGSDKPEAPSNDAENERGETEELTDGAVAATAKGAESPAGHEEGQTKSQVKSGKWAVDRLSHSQEVAAKYAAKNWIIHYKLAGVSGNLEHDEPFSNFTNDSTKVGDWLCLVEYLACASLRRDVKNFVSSSLTRLQRYLEITKFQDLELLYALASRPSSILGLDWLFVHAAESGDEAMVQSISTSELGSLLPESVYRALATSSGNMHDELRKHAAALFSKEDDPQWLAPVQITAQVLGNDTISKKLGAELLAVSAGTVRESWFSDALHRAIEYGDDQVIKELRKHQGLTKQLDNGDEPRWTVMHKAADRGSLQVVTRLWGAGLKQSVNIASPYPDCRNPLFIACSRGFAHIAEFLIAKEARVDEINGPLEQTGLHAASHHGHWSTTTTIIDKAAVTAVDSGGNFSLHLAIKQGHTRIAERLVEAFPDIPAANDASQVSDRSNTTTPRLEKGNSVSFADESPPVGDDRLLSIFELLIEEKIDQDAMSTVADDRYAPLNLGNLARMNALFAAAERDLPTVGKRLLERRADPNILCDRSRLPLHMAAEAGSVSLITDLLDKGTVVNHCTSGLAATPLHYSCYQGHTDAVKLLADQSDLTIEDANGRTPLSAACAGGHLPVVKFLMSRYNKRDWVPGLTSAARYGHREVARHLLDMGCPVNETDTAGQTAFLSATYSSQPRMVELLLLRMAKPVMTNSSGVHVLFSVLEAEQLDLFGLLIDIGASLETARDDGFTILTRAMYLELAAFVRLLLERGARLRLPERWRKYDGFLEFSYGLSSPPITSLLLDYYVQGKREDGMTAAKALIVAMKRGSYNLLELVLEKWFPSNDEGSHEPAGEALHYAASRGSFLAGFLEVMLRNQAVAASIDDQQPRLGTPLHAAIAATTRSRDMVGMLLKHGADAKIVAGRFGTTLNAACVAANLEIVEDLVGILPSEVIASTTGKYGTAIQSAIVGCRDAQSAETTIKMLDLLAAKSSPVLHTGGFYGTSFHAAVRFSPQAVIDWFMKENSQVVITMNDAGIPPLHLAIAFRNWDFVEKLTDAVNALVWPASIARWFYAPRDYQSRNGLHYAAVARDETIMAKALSQSSDSVNAVDMVESKDADGWTPLHWACRQRKKEIVDALLVAGANIEALTNNSWTPRHIAILHGITDKEYLGLLPDSGKIADELPGAEGHRFGKDCDICFVEMYWKCYRCKSEECGDGFNLCFKCYEHAGWIHDVGHKFECILE